MRRGFATAVVALAIFGVGAGTAATANAATITLKGATKWYSLGQGAEIVSMKAVGRPHQGKRLHQIGATDSGLGCWAGRGIHESTYCIVLQNCRMGGCDVRGTLFGVTVQVRYRRR